MRYFYLLGACLLFSCNHSSKNKVAESNTIEDEQRAAYKNPLFIDHRRDADYYSFYRMPRPSKIDSMTYFIHGSFTGCGAHKKSDSLFELSLLAGELFAHTSNKGKLFTLEYESAQPDSVKNIGISVTGRSFYTRKTIGQCFIVLTNYSDATLQYYGKTIHLEPRTSHYVYTNFKCLMPRGTTDNLYTDTTFIQGVFERDNEPDSSFLQDVASLYDYSVRFIKPLKGEVSCRIPIKNFSSITDILPFISEKIGCSIKVHDKILLVY
jgi:hypothetical protein